jgi:hypothetical protein
VRLATTNFRGKRQNLNFRVNYLWSTDRSPGDGGDSGKFNITTDYPNDVWNARASFDLIGKDYDPAVGFRFRSGIRQYDGNFFWNPRPRGSFIRQINVGGGANVVTDLTGRRLSYAFRTKPLGVSLQSGDNLGFNVTPTWERLDQDFRLPGSIELAEGGTYSFTRYNVSLGSADQRMLSGSGNVEWGDFYSGTRRDLNLAATVRPLPGVSVSTSGAWSRLDLVEGSVSTAVLQTKLGTQLSPWISLSNNLQYDNQSRALGWQARFRWILSPGNDVFFVYSHNWIDDPTGLLGLYTYDHTAQTKIVFTQRF